MSDKSVGRLTLATALVGTIVICILAYKLNAAQDRINGVTSDPVGFVKGLFQ